MNLAYFKKSKYSKEETVSKLKEHAKKFGMSILGEIELPKSKGILYQLCKSEWLDEVVFSDKNLIGLMPCGVAVIDNNGEITVGAGNATVLGGVSQNSKIQQLSIEAESKIRELINETTGFVLQRPSNVKVYSTTTCPYCTMEKQWLESKFIKHEVVYVDQNQHEAENMVKETGQMGVPVTEVQYPDGEKEFVVGFDRNKLASLLSINA
jgi:glutaredoxin/uncharacterized protein (DUF302 family)